MCWTDRGGSAQAGAMPRPLRTPFPGTASATIRGDTVLTALTPIVWGTTYLVTSELLPPAHPLFAGLMRALPAGLLALLLARTLPRGAWWWRSLVLGTLNIGAFFPLLFIAAEELPGGVAATLAAIQPLVVALLAVVVLAEPPSWGRILWGLAGVAGVALVVLGPGAGLSLLGIVLTKHWGQPVGVGPMGFAGWQLTAGGLVMLLLTAAFEGAPARIDAPAIGGYLWLGLLGGLLAYSLWFRGIARLPVTATALLVLLSPLTAAVLGMVVLGERFTPVQALGFALALIALTAGQLPGRPTARASTLKPMPDRSTPTAQEVTS